MNHLEYHQNVEDMIMKSLRKTYQKNEDEVNRKMEESEDQHYRHGEHN